MAGNAAGRTVPLGELQMGFTQSAGGNGEKGCVRLLLEDIVAEADLCLGCGLREEPRASGPAGPHSEEELLRKEPRTRVPYLQGSLRPSLAGDQPCAQCRKMRRPPACELSSF